MEKFIRIESTLINVNTIAAITPDFYNDNQYIVIHTKDGDMIEDGAENEKQ